MDEIIKKEYLDSNRYIILDINNENVLDNLEVDSISLQDDSVINVGDKVYKEMYTDIINPLVYEKEGIFKERNLFINPEYYINNIDKINNILYKYYKNCKIKKISINSSGLINNKTIDAITSNSNIERVSLTKYSKEPYALTLNDYKKFKKSNIKVDTKLVSDELKNNFDDIILCNSEKNLISYYKYRDLISKKTINLDKELTEYELENLKYINSDLMIILNIENFEHIKVINNRLKELGKKNNIKIKIENKNKFNKFIFNSRINYNNIYVETPDLENVTLSDYLKFEKILYSMVKNTNNLSPFEKYIYAYNITKQFKEYKENENDKNLSRKLYQLLANEYMVCVGYSRLLGDLLDKMGIENKDLGISVDISYDNVDNMETNFDKSIPVERAGHARRYIHIVDEKYGIDGYYVADPTWDNDLEHDYYNYLAMTDNESTLGKRFIFMNSYMDLFNVTDIDNFIEKCNLLRNKSHYDNFVFEMKRVVDVLKSIDINIYNKLKNKYDFIDKSTYKWPDKITEFVYDLGNEIVNKTNKPINSDVIFKAIENVYKNSYGYSDDELQTKLEQIRQENIERQSEIFPTRYRINQDGTKEIIMNEDNKFDSFIKM